MPTESKNEVRPGDTVRVYQRIPASLSGAAASKKEGERLQVFEGRVLARKHGNEPGATITVRKEISGIGVEKIFPIHSPLIDRIEIVKKGKPRRAKLYYLRKATGQRAKIKER